MRISELKKKAKFLIPFLTPQSAIYIPHLSRHLSLGQQRILFALALFILVIIYFQFYYHPFRSPPEENVREVVVEVLGEVRNPGIYLFQNTLTLGEAIEKAGGLKETTIFDMDSSLEILETGTLVTIVKESSVISPFTPHPAPSPHRGESKRPDHGGRGEGPLLKGGYEGTKQEVIKVKLGRMEAHKLLVFSIPLDLNRVTVEDLCLISGIGESLAREIVTHRERRRGFRSVEELKNVKGIGEKKHKDLKGYFIIK
jgi:competence ComEA-like helix-hairpin-helix protein